MAAKFKVTVIQSANAVPAEAEGYAADALRSLSAEGIEQARVRAHQLGTIYAPRSKFSRVISAAPERALMTAEVVTGIPRDDIYRLEPFCSGPAITPEQSAAHDAALARYGDAALATYLDDEICRGAVINIGWTRLVSSFLKLADIAQDGDHFIVFTHERLAAAGIYNIVFGTAFENVLREISMREAGGYTVTLKDRTVVGLVELPALEAQQAA